MSLRELLTGKNLLILGIIMVLVGALSLSVVSLVDLSTLGKASLVSSSVIESDGISYVALNINQDPYTKEAIGLVNPIETKHVEFDGATNSDDETISGTMDVKLEVRINDVGFGALVNDKYETFVNKIWLEGTIFKTVETETGQIKYYQVTDDVTPFASYTIYATVDDEEYSVTVDETNWGERHVIPNTDPAIYWEDSSLGITPDTQLVAGIFNVDILGDENGVVFADRSNGNVEDMAQCWNAILTDDVFAITAHDEAWFSNDLSGFYDFETDFDGYVADKMNRRIDLNNDDGYDVTSTPTIFTQNNFISNVYRFKTSDIVSNPFGDEEYQIWLDFPDINREPFFYDKNPTGYYISSKAGDTMLMKDTTLTIKGVWMVPAEYGTVIVETYNPIPEIVGEPEFTETMYAGLTTTTLNVDVKNNGETGYVTVRITSSEVDVPITLPVPQNEEIASGATKTFTFEFKATSEAVENIIVVSATGGMTTVTKDVIVNVLGAPDENAIRYGTTITAVNKDGTPLGSDFPITVAQTTDTQYGVWIGDLLPSKTKISGEETVFNNIEYYPNDFYYTAAEEASINLIYTIDPPSTGEEGISFMWYMLGAVILGIVILGSYMYSIDDKNKKR